MSTPASPVSTVTDAVSGLSDDLLQIGGIGVAIGAAMFGLRKGWSFLKGMAK